MLCAALVSAGASVTSQQATAVAPETPGVLTGGAVLTAGAAQLQGLVYEGTVTVTTPQGPVEVLRLAGTAASLTGLLLQVECTPTGLGAGLAADVAGAPGAAGSLSGGFTLHTTAITGTSPAGPVSWTPASPPPAAQLGDAALTDVNIQVTGLTAASLTLPGLRESARFC